MVISDEAFRKLSASIACMRFPLVLAVLLLHAESSIHLTDHPLYSTFIYPLALWFGDTGVPAYFFISSLLLYYSAKTYMQQIKTRVRTLLVPYLIWNGLYLLLYMAAYWILRIDVPINSFSQADFTFTDYLRCFWDRNDWDQGNFRPILTPMWYVRNLMLLYLVSPVIYYIIRTTHLLMPALCCWFWINDPTISLIWQSLTMFSLGALFPVLDINPMDLLDGFKEMIIGLFVVFGLADCVTHMYFVTPYNLQIHRLALITNTFFCIWLGYFLHQRGVESKYLSKTAFFVFCVHYPIMMAVRGAAGHFPQWSDVTHIIVYFLSVALVTAVCLGLYELLNRYCPWFLHKATGDRG